MRSWDIFETIDEVRKVGIRCSVLGLTAEVNVFKQLTLRTNGSYKVALSAQHFVSLFNSFIHASVSEVEGDATRARNVATMVKVGFPSKLPPQQFSGELGPDAEITVAMCADSKDLKCGGFYCPQCYAVSSQLPAICKTCGLQLVSYVDLARTYYNLYPVPVFDEVELQPEERADGTLVHTKCRGCTVELKPDQLVLRCPKCGVCYCFVCDEFARTVLKQCPTCPPPTPKFFVGDERGSAQSMHA